MLKLLKEKNQTGYLKLMNKWVFVILEWRVLWILAILSPPQGLSGTITKVWYHALSKMVKRNIEQELINGAITHNFLAAADPVSRLLTSQVCW